MSEETADLVRLKLQETGWSYKVIDAPKGLLYFWIHRYDWELINLSTDIAFSIDYTSLDLLRAREGIEKVDLLIVDEEGQLISRETIEVDKDKVVVLEEIKGDNEFCIHPVIEETGEVLSITLCQREEILHRLLQYEGVGSAGFENGAFKIRVNPRVGFRDVKAAICEVFEEELGEPFPVVEIDKFCRRCVENGIRPQFLSPPNQLRLF